MKYAKITKGKVDIILIENTQILKELKDTGLEIIDISSEVQKPQGGWTYSGTTFSKPVPTPEVIKPKPKPIKLSTLSDTDFKKLVLEKLGLTIEEE